MYDKDEQGTKDIVLYKKQKSKGDNIMYLKNVRILNFLSKNNYKIDLSNLYNNLIKMKKMPKNGNCLEYLKNNKLTKKLRLYMLNIYSLGFFCLQKRGEKIENIIEST